MAKAPCWGGFFERLMKQVKSCLKKTLGRSKLSFDELTTIFAEVEAVLNSRPLTYLYSDDVEEPLTPSHLVIGRRLLTLPVGPLQIDDWAFGDHLTATKRSRYLTSIRTAKVGDQLTYFFLMRALLSCTTREPHRERSGSLPELEI